MNQTETLTHMLYDALSASYTGESATVTHEGLTATVTLERDTDSRLTDADWFGHVEVTSGRQTWAGYYAQRPASMNGNAELVYSDWRNGRMWWQPPADVKRGTPEFDAMRKRVRGWFNDDWYFVGCWVSLSWVAPCGHTETTEASLWGIESDAGEYFREVIGDLLAQCATEQEAAHHA